MLIMKLETIFHKTANTTAWRPKGSKYVLGLRLVGRQQPLRKPVDQPETLKWVLGPGAGANENTQLGSGPLRRAPQRGEWSSVAAPALGVRWSEGTILEFFTLLSPNWVLRVKSRDTMACVLRLRALARAWSCLPPPPAFVG